MEEEIDHRYGLNYQTLPDIHRQGTNSKLKHNSVMDNYHITFKGNEWKFTKSGNSKASKIADTKDEIINKMQDYMSDRDGSVKIHKKNGQFQEERTYPRRFDPSSSPG